MKYDLSPGGLALLKIASMPPMPFAHPVDPEEPGLVDIDVTALLKAYVDSWQEIEGVLEAIVLNLDGRAAEVEKALSMHQKLFPATLDEADRGGYLDGLRASARHVALVLAERRLQAKEVNGG